ncbi:LOW QUALITY PROTEIN: hypothetical protein ACHAXR_010950 [Thalassiosira sp. AJA248-18]
MFMKPISGITMRISPAPTISNLFVAIDENSNILPFLQTFLRYHRHFIDDGFGIWLNDLDPVVDTNNWVVSKAAVNNGGLEWTFSKRSQSVVFTGMTVEIVCRYAKPLALYLYIPPHSCHTPGVLSGLIFGQVLRIYQLREKDIESELKIFFTFTRLLDRGYHSSNTQPIFSKAINNALCYLLQRDAYCLQLREKKIED